MFSTNRFLLLITFFALITLNACAQPGASIDDLTDTVITTETSEFSTISSTPTDPVKETDQSLHTYTGAAGDLDMKEFEALEQYGGHYFDYEGKLHVLLSSDTADDQTKQILAGADVKDYTIEHVDHSMADLEAALLEVQSNYPVFDAYIDVMQNQIVALISPGIAIDSEDLLSSNGVVIEFKPVEGIAEE